MPAVASIYYKTNKHTHTVMVVRPLHFLTKEVQRFFDIMLSMPRILHSIQDIYR
jgi:hypothetical protein